VAGLVAVDLMLPAAQAAKPGPELRAKDMQAEPEVHKLLIMLAVVVVAVVLWVLLVIQVVPLHLEVLVVLV